MFLNMDFCFSSGRKSLVAKPWPLFCLCLSLLASVAQAQKPVSPSHPKKATTPAAKSAGEAAAPPSNRRATTPADGLLRLKVQSGGGKVIIRASDAQTAQARAEAALGGETCGLVATREKEVWTVKTHNQGAGVCDVALVIDLPKHAAVDVTMVSGNLMMSGLVGDLIFDITEGNAVVGNGPEHIRAHLGQGSLSAQGLRGAAELTLEHGNLQLFLHPQMTGTVNLAVAHGNVSVVVPPKAIACDVALGRGKSSSNVDSDAASGIKIVGTIDAGDLKVRSSS